MLGSVRLNRLSTPNINQRLSSTLLGIACLMVYSSCLRHPLSFLPRASWALFLGERPSGSRYRGRILLISASQRAFPSFLRFPFRVAKMHLQEETEGSKEVQGLHFPHLALAFPVACYRLVTNFQETNRQQETHARSVNLRLSRNLSQPWVLRKGKIRWMNTVDDVGKMFTVFNHRVTTLPTPASKQKS